MSADSNNTTPQRIPVILTGHALRSLRDSGFSLSAALAEVVDNSLEAQANNVTISLEEATTKGKKHIHRIAVADDGSGMDEEILKHYLQIGFSTRYMRTDTIGKYGVGAKLAALNFGRKIEVWSRTAEEMPWRYVVFDLDEVDTQDGHGVFIDPPVTREVPQDLIPLLPPSSGTLIVWSKVDRLEEGRRASDAKALRSEVEKELSRIFRNWLHDGISIEVDGTKLLPHDPLYQMDRTFADKMVRDYYTRLSKVAAKEGKEFQADLIQDHYPARRIGKQTIPFGGSSITLTVTLYPREVLRRRQMGGDELARTIRLPENQGAISFVRQKREINYAHLPMIFSRGIEEADRFIGVEVAFTPELDDAFGVRNVKRGVEPYEELRALIKTHLKPLVDQARDLLEEAWGTAAKENEQHKGEHSPILEAAKEANRTLPKSRVKDTTPPNSTEKILDKLAEDVVGNDDKAKQEYRERIKDLPFILESVDFPGNTFLDIQHVDGQVIIRLNTRHRFYQEMWDPIRSIAQSAPGSVSGDEAVRTARRTLEALTLLVIAYGKAESMDDDPREQYGDLRMFWGQFLDSLMGKVKNVI